MRLGFKLFLITFLIAVSIPSAYAHTPNSITIEVSKDGFSPNEVTILKGDVVFFISTGEEAHWPASNIHPTHEIYSEFDSRKPIKVGEEWSFRFNKEGQWTFHDHLNPQFTGVITVLEDNHESGSSSLTTQTEESESKGVFSRIRSVFRNFASRIASFFRKNESTRTGTVEFREPPQADKETVYQSFDFDCDSNGFNCIKNSLRDMTDKYGPEAALLTLERLQEEGQALATVDDHQLAHHIGRQAAESYGVNSESFLLCPMNSYNGGCQHGFFEYVLGQTDSTKEAADVICESLGDEYSIKARFYCYHGVGHGVMMAQAYDLQSALNVCDTFDSYFSQDGCWQGVFMENVTAGMSGEAREGIFDENIPLEPCSLIEKKYRHECFINHAGWLMVIHGNSVYDSTRECLNAPNENNVSSCMESVGLMVTNPSWQSTLSVRRGETPVEIIAWELCMEFPESHQGQCVIGAVDNILNFDELDVSRAKNFCSTVSAKYKNSCYAMVGNNLYRQATDESAIHEQCARLEEFESICLRAAGIL